MMTASARRICVTGAAAKAGRVTARELREHGYEVVATGIVLTGDDVSGSRRGRGSRSPGCASATSWSRATTSGSRPNWPHLRERNLWGYAGVRDVATACRLGLQAGVTGSHNVIIAAPDTVLDRPSREVLAEVFPGVPVSRETGESGTLPAADRARRVLGYGPRYSRRDHR